MRLSVNLYWPGSQRDALSVAEGEHIGSESGKSHLQVVGGQFQGFPFLSHNELWQGTVTYNILKI